MNKRLKSWRIVAEEYVSLRQLAKAFRLRAEHWAEMESKANRIQWQERYKAYSAAWEKAAREVERQAAKIERRYGKVVK